MSGIEDFNYPEFKRQAEKLRAKGHFVNSPAEVKLKKGIPETWSNFMRKDMILIANSDTIALMPGWEKSRGATLELFIATQLGMSVMIL